MYLTIIIYLLDIGYTQENLIDLQLVSYGVFLLSLLFGGRLVDVLNYKRSMVVSLGLYTLIPIATYLASGNFQLLMLVSAVSGMAASIIYPASSILTYSVVPVRFLKRAFFVITISSASAWIGYALSGPLYSVGQAVPFYLSSLLTLIAMVLTWSALGRIQPQNNPEGSGTTLLSRFADPRFLVFAVFSIILSVGNAIFMFLIPMNLLLEIRMLPSGVSAALSLSLAASFVAAILLGRFLKLRSTRWCIAFFFLLSLVSFLSYSALVLGNMLASVFLWTSYLAISSFISMYVFSNLWRYLNIKSGFQNAVFELLSSTGSVLGILSLKFSPTALPLSHALLTYAVCALVCALASAALLELVPKPKGSLGA
jgi:predicted MFS family arabinose efflux permease